MMFFTFISVCSPRSFEYRENLQIVLVTLLCPEKEWNHWWTEQHTQQFGLRIMATADDRHTVCDSDGLHRSRHLKQTLCPEIPQDANLSAIRVRKQGCYLHRYRDEPQHQTSATKIYGLMRRSITSIMVTQRSRCGRRKTLLMIQTTWTHLHSLVEVGLWNQIHGNWVEKASYSNTVPNTRVVQSLFSSSFLPQSLYDSHTHTENLTARVTSSL